MKAWQPATLLPLPWNAEDMGQVTSSSKAPPLRQPGMERETRAAEQLPVAASGPNCFFGRLRAASRAFSSSLNVLLINYGPADNNSAYHILGHAAALATRGHAVCVGVVKGTPEGFAARDDDAHAT